MVKERAIALPLAQERDWLIEPEHIPRALIECPQWLCWRFVDRGKGKKPDKQPVNPKTLHNAGVHWPNTWTNFAHAYATYQRYRLAGIGFVLTPTDPYVAVDLDHCVSDAGMTPTTQALVEQLNSYTEFSPSGHGLHILLTCTDLPANRRTPTVEVYAHSRFLTMTGRHLPGSPATLAYCSPEQLAALLPMTPEHLPSVSDRTQPVKPAYAEVQDMELWERIFAYDHYGNQHRQRFSGNTSLEGDDHSFTVIRLLNCLARWTNGDPDKMRRMLLLSPLANAKWLSKRGTTDWLDHQIADAIAYVSGKKRT